MSHAADAILQRLRKTSLSICRCYDPPLFSMLFVRKPHVQCCDLGDGLVAAHKHSDIHQAYVPHKSGKRSRPQNAHVGLHA
jgi:hypothetical protein